MADGITYAGQPVLLDIGGELRSYLAARWPESCWPTHCGRLEEPHRSSPFFGRTGDRLFASPYPSLPAPEINELIVPTGATRYARALVVMAAEQLTEVAKTVWEWEGEEEDSDITEEDADKWGDSQIAADLKFECNEKIFKWPMHALTPILLDATGDRNLWLVPLVDSRFFWNRKPLNASLPNDPQWSDVFGDIGTAIGETITAPTVDAAYVRPDRAAFMDPGLSAAAALDAAALSVGHRVVLADDGAVAVQAIADADTQHDLNIALEGLRLGGEFPRHPLPTNLRIVCPVLQNYLVACGEHFTRDAAIDADSTSDSAAVIYSTFWAEHFEGAIDSTSQTAIEALVAKMASDAAAWHGKHYAASFAAVAEWVPTGRDDYVTVCAEESAGQLRVTTKAVCLPPNFLPRFQLSQKAALFVLDTEGLYFKVPSGGIPAISGNQLGSAECTPYQIGATGIRSEKKDAAGNSVPVMVWHAGSDQVESDGNKFVQAKRIGCVPVVDVDYCE